MRGHASWSLNLGRWGSLRVRLHMLFLLFGAFTLYLSWLAERDAKDSGLMWAGVLSLGVLGISVLLHELAHCLAAARLGGRLDEIVLAPWGGLTSVNVPGEPTREMAVALAGPAMNLAVCLICAIPLAITSGGELLGLLHPLMPAELWTGTPAIRSIKLIFWVNWLLLVVNLLPAFPFDGGRVLRASLMVARPEAGRGGAVVRTARVAKLVVIGLCLVAIWLAMRGAPEGAMGLVPPWFALVLLAIFVFFSAQQEETQQREQPVEEAPFGYDFSQGYTSLERTVDSEHELELNDPLTRWIESRREQKRQRQEEVEAEEDQLMDDILARLHRDGMNGLSAEDRALLDRVSARLRSRQSS